MNKPIRDYIKIKKISKYCFDIVIYKVYADTFGKEFETSHNWGEYVSETTAKKAIIADRQAMLNCGYKI